MIKSKLIKLVKRLHKFTIEDFVALSDEDEAKVKEFLNILIADNIVGKIGENKFIYKENEPELKSNNLVFASFKKHTVFTDAEIIAIDKERNSLESFINAPKSVQRMINKYVDLLIEVNNTKGNKLDIYIQTVWNKNNPDKATTKSAFLRAKSILKKFGVAGLITPNRKFLTTNSQIDESLYQEFKNYIYKNMNKSIKYNYIRFRAEYLQKNPEEEKWEFPSYNSVTTRIQRDILKFQDSKLAKIYDVKKKVRITQKKYGFKTFEPAAEDYLKDLLEKNELKKETFKAYERIITLHLVPFFKNIKFIDISESKISEYKRFMSERHYSANKITCHINLLKKISEIYSHDVCKITDTKKVYAEFANEMNILKKTQVQHLLDQSRNNFPDFYPLLVTAVNTGLTRGEILSLTWDKIDFKNKKLKVNQSIHNGNIVAIRIKHANRYVDLPDEIVKILMKIKKSSNSIFVFPDKNGDFQNPEDMINNKFKPLAEKAGLEDIKFIDLRNTYIVLLLTQNMSLSYVKAQVGFSNLNNLEAQFKKYIPEQKKNFCLI